MKKSKVSAFTLIELIISSLIFSVVAVAVYFVFSGGINVWESAKDTRDYDRSLRLAGEVIARELRNSFKISNISFEGDKDIISFAGIWKDFSSEEAPEDVLGRITYFLNQENIFCRKRQTYQEVFQGTEAGKIKELISDVSELSFSYFGFDDESETYQWRNSWPKTRQEAEEESIQGQEEDNLLQVEKKEIKLPKAVKIEMKMGEKSFSKTILIPVD